MCLVKLHRFPRISTKPIKCYKKVLVADETTFLTMAIRHKFSIGDTIKSKTNSLWGIFFNKLTDEVVHAFTVSRFDIAYMNMYNTSLGRLWGSTDSVFIECEIPPYTLYYLGDFGEIGASRIKTIKVV